jgi:hypothetical protein
MTIRMEIDNKDASHTKEKPDRQVIHVAQDAWGNGFPKQIISK